MRISADIRAYAAENGVDESTALTDGMRAKSEEFAAQGGKVYLPLAD
jgi:phosphomethylpyrimidine synthase